MVVFLDVNVELGDTRNVDMACKWREEVEPGTKLQTIICTASPTIMGPNSEPRGPIDSRFD